MKCPKTCPSYCCRKFLINLNPNNPKEREIIQYVVDELGYMVKKVKGVSLTVIGDCKHLDENNKCDDYENRPQFCKDFNCWETKSFKEHIDVYKKHKDEVDANT